MDPSVINRLDKSLAAFFFASTGESAEEVSQDFHPNSEKTNLRSFLDKATSGKVNARNPKSTRIPWAQYRKKKLDIHRIQEQLASFTACCTHICFSFLTWQVVLQGRLEYVGLNSTEERRTYLDRYLDEHCIGPASFWYSIPVVNQKTRLCCAKAWRFVHGVPEITHKRATGRHNPNRSNRNKVEALPKPKA